MILEGRAVVVSGVGSGLEREVAALAIRDGAHVVLRARTEAQLERVAKEPEPWPSASPLPRRSPRSARHRPNERRARASA